jgi:hypothetical protein
MQAVATKSGQWILAASDHAQNGIAPIQAVTGLAFQPGRSQFSAKPDEATDHLGHVVIDLIGPVLERTVESRDSGAATIRTHWGALPVRRK